MMSCFVYTVKPVLSDHLKIGKIKVLKTDNGSLMQVESIAECSLGPFCNTLACIKRKSVLKTNFWYFFLSGRLRRVLLY